MKVHRRYCLVDNQFDFDDPRTDKVQWTHDLDGTKYQLVDLKSHFENQLKY